MRGIHWFRYDLRLHDNPALTRLAESCDEMLCVYIIDQGWFESTSLQSQPMGKPRQQFLKESLVDLQASLQSMGEHLLVLQGQPDQVLGSLIEQFKPDLISVTQVPATYETMQLQRLQKQYPEKQWLVVQAFTLFVEEQLPFQIQDLPHSFTPNAGFGISTLSCIQTQQPSQLGNRETPTRNLLTRLCAN